MTRKDFFKSLIGLAILPLVGKAKEKTISSTPIVPTYGKMEEITWQTLGMTPNEYAAGMRAIGDQIAKDQAEYLFDSFFNHPEEWIE